ncbi:MAG: hypothetical protein EON50_08655 [Acidovorax sp.]|nr:MAG: hypothetical protein EON50_08655 [Acidovorax sp.]
MWLACELHRAVSCHDGIYCRDKVNGAL